MADEAGVYSEALAWATNRSEVKNIALTGPYGSGKSSIIKSFLKNYRRDVMQISLAAFLPDANGTTGEVSRQEIERSILQQMLYGADANRLPLSRFKRIQSPSRWSVLISFYILIGIISCWHLVQNRELIVNGDFFRPFDFSNWLNLFSFLVGSTFIWKTLHHIYVASFGISLKSISLKDIEITPEAATEESILNRHLDEIIYFFQSTNYELFVIEDLDRFNSPEIFVTLREINSLINENSGVDRTIRFLYALRDDIFVNTDRTKFFEFIIPVIPIINSSNSIDKVLEHGKRLSIDSRLNKQFLHEVSRYLNDLRLIQNIFNEYAIYVASLETDGENILDANKLLAVLIYKNVFPNDFESLHRGKGNLAAILGRHDEFIANVTAEYKSEILQLERQIEVSDRTWPLDLQELRKIYAMAVVAKLPEPASSIHLNGVGFVALSSLLEDERIEELIENRTLSWRSVQGQQGTVDISGLEKEVNPSKTFQQRKEEVEQKSVDFKTQLSKSISELRSKISALRVTRFNEIVRQNSNELEDIFEAFGDNKELARFLVFEGYLDDTYYQYTSLFHSGRLSPSDNKFLIQIRGFLNPDPDFQLDNPKEVIAAMRDEDFGQSYVLNVKIADSLLGEPSEYKDQLAKLFEFIGSNFEQCGSFFEAYYTSGKEVSALVAGLVKAWAGFIPAALASSSNLSHVARIIAHLPENQLAALPGKYPRLSEFVSSNLSEILALEIDFAPERLKLLKIKSTDLASIESHSGITRLLFEEGLYELSLGNVDFIFRYFVGIENPNNVHKQHYTSVLKANNTLLLNKIERNFGEYFKNVVLALDDNSEESVPAILGVIGHNELDLDSLAEFLDRQSALVPALVETPARLHAVLFDIEKIEASWENCLSFLSSENYDAEILTEYLNKPNVVAALSQHSVPDGQTAAPLRKFLIDNDALSEEAYTAYVRALPNQFRSFPDDISEEKLEILIKEKKVSFSSENFAYLDNDIAFQILFIEKNIDKFIAIQNEFDLDDDFREKLLLSNIRDEHRIKIIEIMDLGAISNLPSRAAIIGPILDRTGADVSKLDAESTRAIILNSKPIQVQISLFNRLQHKLEVQQVKEILDGLPEPFSDIKPGWGTPRISSTDMNIEFVKWLKARGIISSWRQGSLFDDDIRINLFRK